MPDLARFQSDFAQALADDRTCIGARAVYRNTALYGAVEALRANYPVADAIVGRSMFDAVAAEYAEAAPPRSPVLASYGAGFADWIEHQPWAGDASYLSDVARFERLHIERILTIGIAHANQGMDQLWLAGRCRGNGLSAPPSSLQRVHASR